MWNRQRTDFDLADPTDTSLGHRQVQRWNLPEGWVISKHPRTRRWSARPTSSKPRTARRYLLAGLLGRRLIVGGCPLMRASADLVSGGPVGEGAGDGGGPAGDLQQAVDVFQVGPYRSLGYAQAAGDLAVGVPGGD